MQSRTTKAQITLIILLLVCSFYSSAQKKKIIYDSTFFKQKGKLEIVRNDSIKSTLYKTEESEMIVSDNKYGSTLPHHKNKTDTLPKRYRLDTLAGILFKNRLLTSDLLLRLYNIQMPNDTIQIKSATIALGVIEQNEIDHKYFKFKGNIKKLLLFHIAVELDPFNPKYTNFILPNISDFDLYLLSTIEFDGNNLTDYLKTAKTIDISFRGFEI